MLCPSLSHHKRSYVVFNVMAQTNRLIFSATIFVSSQLVCTQLFLFYAVSSSFASFSSPSFVSKRRFFVCVCVCEPSQDTRPLITKSNSVRLRINYNHERPMGNGRNGTKTKNKKVKDNPSQRLLHTVNSKKCMLRSHSTATNYNYLSKLKNKQNAKCLPLISPAPKNRQ